MAKHRRYWDSNIFLSYFKKESGKYEKLLGTIDAINNGEVEIITSAWTFCEVLYYNKEELNQEQAKALNLFFRNDFIIPANVDRDIAEIARDLYFKHEKLSNKDAIHVATAVKHQVSILDTFDLDMIGLSGKIGGPPIKIAEPNIPYQEEMFKKANEPKKITGKKKAGKTKSSGKRK